MITEQLIQFKHVLHNKGEKISASDPAYKIGVSEIPSTLRNLLRITIPSNNWAFEGSVGKGSWSRTPWFAIYDERATSRASDGFFIACIIEENYNYLYLVLMNSSSEHINYTPYKLSLVQAGILDGFTLGPITKGLLNGSRKGGTSFESSTLLWKQFSITPEGLLYFEENLTLICKHYNNIINCVSHELPVKKPFRPNPLLIR